MKHNYDDHGPAAAERYGGELAQAMQLLHCAAGAQPGCTLLHATHGLRNAVTTAHQGRLCRVGMRGIGEGRRPSLTGLGEV